MRAYSLSRFTPSFTILRYPRFLSFSITISKCLLRCSNYYSFRYSLRYCTFELLSSLLNSAFAPRYPLSIDSLRSLLYLY